MNSKKRKAFIKGCCAFIAAASPLTLAMYRADAVYGGVDFQQGFMLITAVSFFIAMAQIAASMVYENKKNTGMQCDKAVFSPLKIKIIYAVSEWSVLMLALLLMTGAIHKICPEETIPYKGLMTAAAAGLLLGAAAIWILSRKK